MNLSSTVKSIQDIMRKDDGVDGDAQRLGQLTWMLFLKVFDQREIEWERNTEKKDEKYVSPIPEDYRWRNWAEMDDNGQGKKSHKKTPTEIITFINNELFPALKDGIDVSQSRQHKVIKNVFEDANNYMKSGPLMLAIIEKLEESINIDDFTIRSNLGDVYEQLLNDLRGAGNAGEFYTPRAITQFMAQMVNPRLDKSETVIDPACGTGGFLTAAISHFLAQGKETREEKLRRIEKLIYGIEKKQLPHLLCTTNMLIHGIDIPDQIDHKNTLGKPWKDWSTEEQYNCIITNPPFGGYEDDGIGSDYPANLRTRETADMFMALMIKKLLKDNGRAAVVLPDGVLFGGGIKGKLKELLLSECNLHTIVRLPKGVFAPYTTIKTNLLFFTRKGVIDNASASASASASDDFATENIWFYEHPYPAGYKSYSKTKPIRIEEFDLEKAWWGSEENDFSEREENKFAWKHPFKEKRAEAIQAAQPYWDKAEQLNDQASELGNQVFALRESLTGTKNAKKREQVNRKIAELQAKAEPLLLQAKDAEAEGDRLYWPIYNLDIKNPNATEEESLDPVVLLEQYKKLLGAIEETEYTLKSELAAALAHHFDGEDQA
jgi:type I restriction enzyme M protein